MNVYFVILQILPTFVYELFETMQSSVTESRTFATKSLPASFKYCNYLLIYSELQQNTKFRGIKVRTLTVRRYIDIISR